MSAVDKAAMWQKHRAEDGRTYYFNRESRVTKWEKPDELKTAQELASVWKEYETDGRTYWVNGKTNESTWTMPAELRPPDVVRQVEAMKLGETVRPAEAVSRAESSRPMESSRPAESFRPMESSRPAESSKRARPSTSARAGKRSRRDSIDSSRRHPSDDSAQSEFLALLRAHNVTSTWTWEQMVRALGQLPAYRVLPTSAQRKHAFELYLEEQRALEHARGREQQKACYAELTKLCVTEYTRARRMQHLLPGYPKDMVERELERLQDVEGRRVREERERVREAWAREVEEWMAEGGRLRAWAEVRSVVLERFADRLMPVLLPPEHPGHLALDHVLNLNDHGARDPERGLSLIDFCDAYLRVQRAHDLRESDERRAERLAEQRAERDNRAAFRQLLGEHHSEFTPMSTWTSLYPLIHEDPRYAAMLGQPGSTPLEMFWDEVEQLNDEVYRSRKLLESRMREQRFRVLRDTPLEEVRAFAGEYCREVEGAHIEYVHRQLVVKAERREEEEREEERVRRARRKRRAAEELREAVLAFGLLGSWEEERPRIAALQAFRELDDEAEARRVFDSAAARMRDKAEGKLRREDSAHKRLRSPSIDQEVAKKTMPEPAAAASAAAAPDDQSSELEEGEMLG